MLWHAELPCARWIGCIKKMKLPSAYCALNWMSKKPFCILNGMCWTNLMNWKWYCRPSWSYWKRRNPSPTAAWTYVFCVRWTGTGTETENATAPSWTYWKAPKLLHVLRTEHRAERTVRYHLHDWASKCPLDCCSVDNTKTMEMMFTAHWHGRWKLVQWLIGGAPRWYLTLIGAKPGHVPYN